MAELPDGIAVVVGGSGGIGGAICARLAELGTDVALTYRGNREAAEATAAHVRAAGRNASVYQLDLTDAAAVAALLDELAAEHGNIHTVVCATGADIAMRYISQVTTEQWTAVMHNDVDGFFHLVKAALPHLRTNGGGSITALTSAGLERYVAKDILSVAPKAAITALLTGVAAEEGRFGVRANTVALGVIDGGMFHRLQGDGLDERWVGAARANSALKRFGTPAEVADVVGFLASKRAAYVTGQVIAMDGGFSL